MSNDNIISFNAKKYTVSKSPNSHGFKYITNLEILRNDTPEEYYEYLFEYLTSQEIVYAEWEEYYKLFKLKLYTNSLTPELAFEYANALESSSINYEYGDYEIEAIKQKEQKRRLIEIIYDLKEIIGLTRK